MINSRWAVLLVALILLPVIAIAVVFGMMISIERQRIADAAPAFEPLRDLRPTLLSQPIAMVRYCNYSLEFSEDSALADCNIHVLTCLNRLPPRNDLAVFLRTTAVTDESLPVLLSIQTFDLLDVTETSISDEGIARLRQAFPDGVVREREEVEHAVPTIDIAE